MSLMDPQWHVSGMRASTENIGSVLKGRKYLILWTQTWQQTFGSPEWKTADQNAKIYF